MQIANVIINFRRHLKRRNYSTHTVKYYLYIIRQYVLWLNVPLEQANTEKIDAYIDHLHRKQLHPASINLYLVILRVFYNYFKYDEQIPLVNPVNGNHRLRVPKPLPKSLRQQDVAQLIDAIDNKRDMAMFTLMLRCGLRVEEVSNLLLSAVDLKGRRILVHQGKGGKDRVVYISDDAHAALSAYLKERSHYRVKKVFLVERGKYKGQPISVRGIQKRMEFYANETRIKASCHCLRHTMATQLLNAEAEIETIQDLLGHNWITTTQRYCKVSNLKVKRDYFKAMRRVQQCLVQPAFHTMLDPG
jgi:site-specific recombinase XerD